jgi:hypothetical protein
VSACSFRIPISEGAPLHLLHEFGQVVSKRYTEDACEVEALVPESVRRKLAKFLVK